MQSPISRWRHCSFAPECVREMALIRKPHLHGNFDEVQSRGNEQFAGTADPTSAAVHLEHLGAS